MTLPILQTDNLAHIYPDVSQELCNKHAKQLSSLKTLFGEIYDGIVLVIQTCNPKVSW